MCSSTMTGMLTLMLICVLYILKVSAHGCGSLQSKLIIGRTYGAAGASVQCQHWGDLLLLRVGQALPGSSEGGWDVSEVCKDRLTNVTSEECNA